VQSSLSLLQTTETLPPEKHTINQLGHVFRVFPGLKITNTIAAGLCA
jgi:hypothetical protein